MKYYICNQCFSKKLRFIRSYKLWRCFNCLNQFLTLKDAQHNNLIYTSALRKFDSILGNELQRKRKEKYLLKNFKWFSTWVH